MKSGPTNPLLHNSMALIGAYALARMVLLATSLQSPDTYLDFPHAVLVRFLPIALVFALVAIPMCLLLRSRWPWAWAVALGAMRSVEFLVTLPGISDLPISAEIVQWYGSELGAPVLGALLGWLGFDLGRRRARMRRAESA